MRSLSGRGSKAEADGRLATLLTLSSPSAMCWPATSSKAFWTPWAFDPYLGFYHQPDYGRPSLALDLLEEFRAPLVDRLSVSLLHLRVLTEDDFRNTPEDGVLLRHEAMKRYFTAYEKEITTSFSVDGEELSFRQLFRRQAERLARALIDNELYEPFRLPC